MSFQQTVWVDLDATLAHYTRWEGLLRIGDPIPGAKGFMADLAELGRQLGFKVGVYTTRTKPDMPGREEVGIPPDAPAAEVSHRLAEIVKDWLDRNAIEHAEVYAGYGKPPGLAYVDDRAVWCDPQMKGPAAYTDALIVIRRMATTKH